jgi:hypothetical protein
MKFDAFVFTKTIIFCAGRNGEGFWPSREKIVRIFFEMFLAYDKVISQKFKYFWYRYFIFFFKIAPRGDSSVDNYFTECLITKNGDRYLICNARKTEYTSRTNSRIRTCMNLEFWIQDLDEFGILDTGPG